MFGLIMPLCNRMFCCIFGWYFYIEIRLKYKRNILLSSSRAFSLSTPAFLLSTPVENSLATWKKATKCNKWLWTIAMLATNHYLIHRIIILIGHPVNTLWFAINTLEFFESPKVLLPIKVCNYLYCIISNPGSCIEICLD